jgi:hypothetical protein
MATSRPRHPPEPPREKLIEARKQYEGKPYTTDESVAAEVGVPPYWVRRWRREGRWAKAGRAVPGLIGMAVAAADNVKVRMSELGKPLDDEVAAQEAAREAATEFAVDVRANVLERHRKEWAAPRKIAYEAVQRGDFERAKLAKITAETLTLIQGGECRAYGINHEARAADGQTVVVVERGGAGALPKPVEPSPDTATGDEGDSF